MREKIKGRGPEKKLKIPTGQLALERQLQLEIDEGVMETWHRLRPAFVLFLSTPNRFASKSRANCTWGCF